jgi:hypothetical protein
MKLDVACESRYSLYSTIADDHSSRESNERSANDGIRLMVQRLQRGGAPYSAGYQQLRVGKRCATVCDEVPVAFGPKHDKRLVRVETTF